MSNSKADWKLFLERLPEWQERHMGKLLEEYKAILEEDSENGNAGIFWKLCKRINNDKRSYGVRASFTKRDMWYITEVLLNDNIITGADLDGFSEDFKQVVLNHNYDD